MRARKRLCVSFVVWVWLVSLCFLLFQCSTSNSQPAEEAGIKKVVEHLFNAFAKKDIDGVMACWAAKSPQLAHFKKSAQINFVTDDDIQFVNITFTRWKIKNDKATVRLRFDWKWRDVKTKRPAQDTFVWNIQFVKDAGGWKWWQYSDAISDLINSLINTKTKEKRSQLLKDEKELVMVKLVDRLNNGSNRRAKQGDFDAAQWLNDIAFETAEFLDDKARLAWCYVHLGFIFHYQALYSSAVENYQHALSLFRKPPLDKAGEAGTLNNIGEVYRLTGKYTEALAQYKASLKIAKEIDNKVMGAKTLANIGNVYESWAQYAKALAKYNTSLKVFQQLGMKVEEAATLDNIGSVYHSMGSYANALKQHFSSLKIQRELISKALINRAVEANTLGSIGNVYYSAGKYKEALANYEASNDLFQQLGMKGKEANTLGSIGNVHYSTGQYDKALTQYKESLKIYKEIGDKEGEANTLSNIGSVLCQKGEYEAALEKFEGSLEIYREISDSVGEAKTLHNIGNVYYSKGKYEAALEKYEEGLKISKTIESIDTAFQFYRGKGNVFHAQEKWKPAAKAYCKAIELIEEVRTAAKEPSLKIGFFAKYTTPYHGLVACLLALNKKEEAFQTAERAKARTLVEILQGGRVEITKAMTREEIEKEQRLNGKVRELNAQWLSVRELKEAELQSELEKVKAQLNSARQDYDAFRRTLYLKHTDLAGQRGETSPISLAEVSKLLSDSSMVFLEYLIGDEQSYLFVITRQLNSQSPVPAVKVYPLTVTPEELTRIVRSFRERLKPRKQAINLPEARRLYDLLVAPAEEALKGKKVIGIVPDGVLWEVPFQALKKKADQYLVESHAVFYAPSLTALNAMQQLVARRRSDSSSHRVTESPILMAMAHPVLGATRRVEIPLRGSFDELSNTEKEVTAIAALFGKKARVYPREKATEQRAKQDSPHYQLLHFATHGIFDPDSPMYSGILLTQLKGQQEDGYLEAREIVDLDLNADLAVLSACETGRGDIRSGEGILGLSWALFVAGCPSSVLSQWAVHDKSTAELMREFYRHLRDEMQNPKSEMSKAEALRQAQLMLLRDGEWAHPCFWAPFILVGEWR